MCGIAGELDWERALDTEQVEAMTAAMVHRGPDSGATDKDGPVVLGHRRLSIIDTRAIANQPMWNQQRNLCIVFNGEIYNFKEIRALLVRQNYDFQTDSDTEVILHAYAHFGIECLRYFVGMYVFALWDQNEQRLFIARDRMGEKPLYYHIAGSHLIFASELKALKKHRDCPKDIDSRAISEFLSLNYVTSGSCILAGVEKLPPSHYMLVQRGEAARIEEYWSLKNAFLEKPSWESYEHAQQRLNDLLRQSVGGQLISDVPLGAFLSGGIDSSTIVSKMAKLSASDTKTFSIGFKERTYSELPESERVAEFLNVAHRTKIVDLDMATHLPRIVASFDEPFADSSMIPTYFLCEFTRNHVTVSLSGDGGDELFLGYDTYVADKLHRLASKVPEAILGSASSALDKLWPVSFGKVSFDYKIRQFLKGRHYTFPRSHYFWRTIFSDEEKTALLNGRFEADSHVLESYERLASEVAQCHYLDQASYIDMKTWLVDDILIKVDQTSMAHSLEVRTPFLDHRVVEFAAGLPVAWKLNGRNTKAILKESQRNHLPAPTLSRKKSGFNAPVSDWLSTDLMTIGKQATYETPIRDFIRTAALDGLWREHELKRADNGLRLFGLACLGLWLDQHKASV